MPPADLSLCMIVRNEERILARCLDSASGLVSEIVAVDTGSTDATAEVAANHGARVVQQDFAFVDFAAARNRSLALATNRWIIVLDADEAICRESVPRIRELVAGDAEDGFYFERLNRRLNTEVPARDYVIRLFPNRPDYRFQGRVHETVDASIRAAGGRLLRSDVRIEHDFASDPGARRQKNLRYIAILEEEIEADPSDASRLEFLRAEYHQLGEFKKAAEIAERVAGLRPLDAEALFRAGACHAIYRLDPGKAREYLKAALRLRPGYAQAQALLNGLTERFG